MSSLGDNFMGFENMQVTLNTTRKIPAIETAGINIKEIEAGRNLTVPMFVALELVESGLARFVDDGITDEEWTQIHYRERFQPLGRPSPLLDDFYSKAYLTFMRELRSAGGDPVRAESLERLRGRFRDILESRIGKITRLASAEVPAQMSGLPPEEVRLYRDLFAIIQGWRKSMRKLGAE